MKKTLALVLMLCLCLVCFAACGGEKDEAQGNPKVVIGVFEPASGDNGAGGKQETLGIQFGKDTIPTVEVGGVTYDVELLIVDNESSNDKAPTAANALISGGASVILGSYGSGVSIAAGDIFATAGVPAIGITCTNPQVTLGNPSYFRICFLDPFQGEVLANYAYNTMGVTNAYCLAKLGDDYSGGLVNYFVQAFENLGGTVTSETFPDGNSDFTAYLTRAKNAGAGVFFSPVSTEAAAYIIDQAAAMGFDMPILAGDTWDSNVITQAATGKNVEILVTTFYQEGGAPETDAAIKAWINGDQLNLTNNNGDDTVAAVTVMGYDAYCVALEAIKAAGSVKPADILAALPTVTYEGVSGAIAFDENGDAIRDVAYIKTVNTENGTWEFVTVQSVEK
ncbi:MAG: ABC transporter substrate-binding protein [Firmicutes bacterium]|nr:ABC transporter substrate-binding protein [Bacillota bacterium]